MKQSDVVIGTRGSPLALWQADYVTQRLREAHPHIRVEREIIRTTGDRILDRPLLEVGGKGLFVKEIEQALVDGRVDLAVHSLKDMPFDTAEGLTLACFPVRGPSDDVMVFAEPSAAFATLRHGARVGTGSLRRGAQLRTVRPDLEIVGIRGNVGTRLGRLQGGSPRRGGACRGGAFPARGAFGSHVGAAHGADDDSCTLSGNSGLEIRAGDASTASWIAALDDADARLAAVAERACLRAVGGDCHTAFGAHAVREGDGLRLRARLLDADGRATDGARMEILRGDPLAQAAALGETLGRHLLDRHRSEDRRGGVPVG